MTRLFALLLGLIIIQLLQLLALIKKLNMQKFQRISVKKHRKDLQTTPYWSCEEYEAEKIVKAAREKAWLGIAV